MSNHCILLAAGAGRRTERSIPKQFNYIKNTPVLIKTINNVLETSLFDSIIIVTGSIYINTVQQLLHDYNIDHTHIKITIGGSTRNESILRGMSYLKKHVLCNDDDIVTIHDSVRPLASRQLFKSSVDAAATYGASTPILYPADSLVQIDHDSIVRPIDRTSIALAQTPESVKLMYLDKALQNSVYLNSNDIVGTAQLLLQAGIPVHIINGESTNIKITVATDFKLVESLL